VTLITINYDKRLFARRAGNATLGLSDNEFHFHIQREPFVSPGCYMSNFADCLKRKHFVLIGCAIIALVIGWGIRVSGSSGRAAQDAPDSAPVFLHKGDRIFIPENSTLRTRLHVEPVTVKDTPNITVARYCGG